MSIGIADNFLYQGRKPLDSRIVKDTINDMINMAESIVYDGIMVYNKETKKFYVFNSSNTEDDTLKKWRELETENPNSGNATIGEYVKDKDYKKNELIVYNNKMYFAANDFKSDNGGGTLANSFKKDLDNGNLVLVGTEENDANAKINNYAQNTQYKANELIVNNDKLYLVISDFTSDNTQTTKDDSLNLDIQNGSVVPVDIDTDTHTIEYEQNTEYTKGQLIVYGDKIYLALTDFTSDDTKALMEDSLNTDISLNNIVLVGIDDFNIARFLEYEQGVDFKTTDLIRYNNKLYLVTVDFTSNTTEATVDDSFNVDFTAGKISVVDIDTDTHTFDYSQNTKYLKGQLAVYEEKLYLVLKDFISDNTGATLADSFKIDYDAKNIIEVDTNIYNEPIRQFKFGTEYAKHTLLTFNDELCLTLEDYTSAAFYDDLANGKIMKVSVCSKEYKKGKYYLKNDLVFLENKLARVETNYWSDNTQTTKAESFQYDINNGYLILIGGGDGDATLSEDVTSNLAVGNIKVGDSFLTGTTFTDFVKKLLIKEILPQVTLTALNSGLKLKGTTVTTPTISATITLGSGTVQKVEFYRGTTLEETQNYVDGTDTYEYNTADINSDIKITVKVYYTESDETTTGTISKEVSYKFMNYSYSGITGSIPTDSDVITLDTNLKDTKSYTQTYTVNDGHIVYAYPSSLGNLTSIKDQNNFEYISSFTKLTMTINAETYNVYYLTDKVTANGIVMKFN